MDEKKEVINIMEQESVEELSAVDMEGDRTEDTPADGL
jgi:hypothetical protein